MNSTVQLFTDGSIMESIICGYAATIGVAESWNSLKRSPLQEVAQVLKNFIHITTEVLNRNSETAKAFPIRYYSRITSPMSPSFSRTTLSASLTNLTAILLQSRDCSCYVSRPILAPPPLWLQKQIYAHKNSRTIPDLWHQSMLADVICAWS
jgi:hypothetical protein